MCYKYHLIASPVWRDSVMVRELDLRGSTPGHALVPLSPSSIIWYRLKGSDALWLGVNRMSGITDSDPPIGSMA